MNLSEVKEITRQYEFLVKKKYGQNFLIDSNIINKIVASANIGSTDTVLEIGPGLGSLTKRLSLQCNKVVCVEIDTKLVDILNDMNIPNVQVINDDILKTDIKKVIGSENIKVVANLPYYISTPIITKLLESEVKTLTIMMQREVADRLRALPNTKEYGSLTIFANYNADISIVTNVSSTCFWPKPNVDSTVLHFNVQKNKLTPKDEKLFYNLVRQAFANRRKTLVNSVAICGDIKKEIITKALLHTGLKQTIRAEQLTTLDYIKLANVLYFL